MSKDLSETIKRILDEEGVTCRERKRTVHPPCPSCGRSDKFSVIWVNGACICYHGSCNFGKQWFDVWLAETAHISLKEARRRIYGRKGDEPASLSLVVDLDPQALKKEEDLILPTDWPANGFMPITHPEAQEGATYLYNRGIPLEVASAYQIAYSPSWRRVGFPVIVDGICYGWQARTIDKDNPMRMLNNTNFRREQFVMFADNIKGLSRVIITEGPVDAIKFYKVGGMVCTMGKGFSDKQLEFLQSRLPIGSQWFLAMDDDAAEEMVQIAKEVSPDPVYRLYVPESCTKRCKEKGKKPDFGECTAEECIESIKNAKALTGYSHIMCYLKG